MTVGLLQRWWYTFCQRCCQLGMVLGYDYRVWGREYVPRRGGVLLVSNHQSFLDPALVAAALPRQVHYMARQSLFQMRVFGWLIRSLNAFPLRRDGLDVGAVRETVARLRRGEVVLVFPEGTRTHDGHIHTLQRGVELLAREGRAPIVPVVIDGAYEVWPRHRRWPGLGPIRVLFGPPLGREEFEAAGRGRVAERLALRLRALQSELRRRRGTGGEWQ